MRASSRDGAERAPREGKPPSVVRESTAESAPGGDDGSRPPPPRSDHRAPMGRGAGSAETCRSHREKKRAVSGELGEEDHRESISRRLFDDGRGQKRPADGDGDVVDQRESISRRIPNDDGQPTPTGTPQQFSPDTVGAFARSAGIYEMKLDKRKGETCEMKSEKKSIRWNSDVSSSPRQLGELPSGTWQQSERSYGASITSHS